MLKRFATLSITNQIAVITAIFTFLGLCVAIVGQFDSSSSTDTNTTNINKQQHIESSQIDQAIFVDGESNTVNITGVPFDKHQQQSEQKKREKDKQASASPN